MKKNIYTIKMNGTNATQRVNEMFEMWRCIE